MKSNISFWDRIARLLFGTLLFAWFVAGGPWWSLFGLVLIATAAWQFCPLYALLHIASKNSTRPKN
jgi:hypothetical protein